MFPIITMYFSLFPLKVSKDFRDKALEKHNNILQQRGEQKDWQRRFDLCKYSI